VEIGVSIALCILGLLLVSFGTMVVIRREQPWVQLDRGLPRVLKSWSALIIGAVSLLLGIGAVLLALVVGGIWK
jgi:hypothetical protein